MILLLELNRNIANYYLFYRIFLFTSSCCCCVSFPLHFLFSLGPFIFHNVSAPVYTSIGTSCCMCEHVVTLVRLHLFEFRLKPCIYAKVQGLYYTQQGSFISFLEFVDCFLYYLQVSVAGKSL